MQVRIQLRSAHRLTTYTPYFTPTGIPLGGESRSGSLLGQRRSLLSFLERVRSVKLLREWSHPSRLQLVLLDHHCCRPLYNLHYCTSRITTIIIRVASLRTIDQLVLLIRVKLPFIQRSNNFCRIDSRHRRIILTALPDTIGIPIVHRRANTSTRFPSKSSRISVKDQPHPGPTLFSWTCHL